MSAAVSEVEHPLVVAVRELADRAGGTLVPVAELRPTDVPLVWEGQTVAGVRLPQAAVGAPPAGAPQAEPPAGDLEALLAAVAAELGMPLKELARQEKQRAVRLLEERGAFNYRKSAETVAEALGVTRFTIYNYLNRIRA